MQGGCRLCLGAGPVEGADTLACPRGDDTQAPPTTGRQKLWFLFLFKFLSLRKLPRRGGRGQLLSRGAEGQDWLPSKSRSCPDPGAATPPSPEPPAGRCQETGTETGPSCPRTGSSRREGMRTGPEEGTEEQGRQRETKRRETDAERPRGPGLAPTHCRVGGSQFWAPSGSVPTQEQTPR